MSRAGRELPAGNVGFDALEIGDWFATGSREITAGMIDAYAELSGDRFPIHMDRGAARERGFPERVAHGLLVMGVIDGLKNQAATRLDALATRAWSWDFSSPVLCGDRLCARVTVAGKRTTGKGDGLLELDFAVRNQRGDEVQRGRNWLLVSGPEGRRS